MRKVIACALLGVLAGCASEYSVPVTGQIGNQAAQGSATARTSGVGSFWVATLSGLRCEGTYDAFDRSPTLQIPARCSDGRTANLLVTRTLDQVSGTVIGRLSDGTQGRFVFGNLAFDQAFGGAGSRTVPVR